MKSNTESKLRFAKIVDKQQRTTTTVGINEALWENFIEKMKTVPLDWSEVTCVCYDSPCSCTYDELVELECDDYIRNELNLDGFTKSLRDDVLMHQAVESI